MHRKRTQLRVLFAVHTPWRDTLGLPRVSIELSRQLILMGHHCDKFSLEDAFPRGLGKIRDIFRLRLFQRRLLSHIREHGHRYDIIQAEHTLLPYPRAAYRFDGHLIAKSNGLVHHYRQFQNGPRSKLLAESGDRQSLAGRLLRRIDQYFNDAIASADKTFATADSIHVLNTDELLYVSEELGNHSKCRLLPNALADGHATALNHAGQARRNAGRTISYVGTWSVRKGQVELPHVIRKVRQSFPDARFQLIGTAVDSAAINARLHAEDRAHVTIVPSFQPEELPHLLEDSCYGIFPSYIEGLPLGLLEMLTAGLQVVAWDVPGPRDLSKHFTSCRLVPAGKIDATANALNALLQSGPGDQMDTVTACDRWPHTWRTIAESFLGDFEARTHALAPSPT